MSKSLQKWASFVANSVPSRAIASHEFRSGSPIRPSPDFGFMRLRLPSLSTVDVRCGPKSRTDKWNYSKTLSIRPKYPVGIGASMTSNGGHFDAKAEIAVDDSA